MWTWIKNILKPPVFKNDENKTDKARLLHNFLAIIIVTGIVFPVVSTLGGTPVFPLVAKVIVMLLATSLGLMFLLHFGFVAESGLILTLVMWGIFTFITYSFGGVHDTSITGFLLVIVLASLVGGWRMLATFSGLSIFSLLSLYIFEHSGIISPVIEIPADAADITLPVAVIIATTFLLRTFINYLAVAYQNARANASRFAEISTELENNRAELAQQTAAMKHRSHYLEAAAQVARDIASELDPETLLRRAATLVSGQFEFYHTGIFLLDPAGEYAVLKAASSEGGQRMLARGHRLQVGKEGIVGHAADDGNNRVAFDTGANAVYFNNPDLPKTRSEAALPLQVGGHVLGVLDVQSSEPEAFNNDNIAVLQTLADQIASALHTAQLFQQATKRLETLRQAHSETRQISWKQFAREEQIVGYRYIQGNVIPVQSVPTSTNTELPEVMLPIRLGGQVIGHITAHKPNAQDTWTEDEISVLETLIDQLGVALESARLYQETQRRAAREQLTGEVTARIRETLDIGTILRTASEEIRRAFGLPEVIIHLGEPPTDADTGKGVQA